jgi:hypothetical protein
MIVLPQMSIDELLTEVFSKMCIVSKQMSIDELCERVYCDGMRTYNIDMLVHQLYWDKIGDVDNHISHQYKIISILKKLNNDDINRLLILKRHYDFRSYLNGNKALMSAILVNSQFILYDYLLSRININDLRSNINIKIDSMIIFFKLINIDYKSIPKKELESIKSILKRLKTDLIDMKIFDSKWWKTFLNKYKDCLSIAMTKEWFSTPIMFDKIIYNYGMDIFEDYLKDTGANFHEFVNWEYCPKFNSYTNNADMQFMYSIKNFYL